MNLIYGSKGRQVTEPVLEAYGAALTGVTDYQLARCADWFLAHHTSEWPPSSAEVLQQAKIFSRSAGERRAKLAYNEEQLRLAALPRIPGPRRVDG